MSIKRPVIVALAALALALPATAQDEGTTVRYQKRTVIDVTEGATLEGSVHGPRGTLVEARGKVRFRSLIVVRPHFRREMSESAGEL